MFQGFSQETVDFMWGIRFNNEKSWFEPHKADYQTYFLQPMKELGAQVQEALLDVGEGADMLMVKPAMSYLDVISRVKAETRLPLAAYSVSGEYAMLRAAGAQGLLDEYAAMCESAAGIFRAGADVLITYYARELAEAIKKGDLG